MPQITYKRTVYSDGVVETYSFDDGTLHREDGPAYILRNGGGEIESYYNHGELHRIDAPSHTFRSSLGLVWEWYSLQGKPREDGPAEIVRGADGTVISETWYKDGQRQPALKHLQPMPEPSTSVSVGSPQRPLGR